jgi:hypothetical protein
MACFNPSIMLSPTVWGFRAAVGFFAAGLDVCFVVMSYSLCSSRVSGHQYRDQAFHRVPLGFTEVRLPVLRIGG